MDRASKRVYFLIKYGLSSGVHLKSLYHVMNDSGPVGQCGPRTLFPRRPRGGPRVGGPIEMENISRCTTRVLLLAVVGGVYFIF